MIGSFDRHCILTLVDRKTGYVMIGKLFGRTTRATNRRATSLIRQAPRRTLSLTVDNGTEFHGVKTLEKATGAPIYFAAPHHSWERGTSENTNGLIRQFLPKRISMAHVTQRECTRPAAVLRTHVLANATASSHQRSSMRNSPDSPYRCTSNLILEAIATAPAGS